MGTNKHLPMKSVFSSLCIFLALLSTASAAGTSVITQKVTYTGLTTATYTGDVKKLIDGGYLWANGWVKTTTTDRVVQPATGITFTATAAAKAAIVTAMDSWSTKNNLPRTAFSESGTLGAAGSSAATLFVTTVAAATTPAPTAAPANATSSASGGVQFSQIALSIPVVAMVISKIC